MSLYVSVQLQQRLVQNSSHLINRQTTLVSILLLKLTLVTTFLDKLGGVFVCFGVKRKETWRLWVWGSVVSFPTGVQGRAPAKNGFRGYLTSERSHLKQLFGILSSGVAPKRRGARENFPSFPPFSMGLVIPAFNWYQIQPCTLVTSYHPHIKDGIVFSRVCLWLGLFVKLLTR